MALNVNPNMVFRASTVGDSRSSALVGTVEETDDEVRYRYSNENIFSGLLVPLTLVANASQHDNATGLLLLASRSMSFVTLPSAFDSHCKWDDGAEEQELQYLVATANRRQRGKL
jgi:hypothetical protein